MTGPAVVSFTPDRAGQDRLLRSPSGDYGRWLTRVGNTAVNYAKARARVDTGRNRAAIGFRLVPEGETLGGELVGRTNYARYVEDGTKYMRGDHNLMNAAREAIHKIT